MLINQIYKTMSEKTTSLDFKIIIYMEKIDKTLINVCLKESGL